MRIQTAPGKWVDTGPVKVSFGDRRLSGYSLAQSPLATLESDFLLAPCPSGHVGHKKYERMGDGKTGVVCLECVRTRKRARKARAA